MNENEGRVVVVVEGGGGIEKVGGDTIRSDRVSFLNIGLVEGSV